MPPLAPLKPFLLHEEPMVRDSVAFYFYESWSGDGDLAPLVLEACGRYGEEATLNLLSFACRFPLDGWGLEGAMSVLASSHPPFVEQWIAMAPLDLVASRAELARGVLSSRATSRLERRFALRGTKVAELWRRLGKICRRLDEDGAEPGDWDEVDDLLEALGALERRENVISKLENLLGIESPHGRWTLVDLAGVMELRERAAWLVGLLEAEDEGVGRSAVTAIARVGSPASIRAIARRYPEGSRRFRRLALAVLKATKHDSAEALLRKLLDVERDPALRGCIFDGLRFHFTEESGSVLRRELEDPTSWMIAGEIRKALMVLARVRGREDRECDRWRRELLASGEDDLLFHIPFTGLVMEEADIV